MQQPILIVDANQAQCSELCEALERESYATAPFHSLEGLESKVKESGCQVVLVDLDTLPVDNRLFKGLRRWNPEVRIIALSSRPFHPELQEAMRTHIYVSLSKPVDPDELIYWLKSICENDADSRDPPGT